MDTLSQVLVATVIAVALGVGLGVLASESHRCCTSDEADQRRAADPAELVYIVPFIYLMPVSIVPGIVAAALYAFPVSLRLVERGVQDVAPACVEAATAFGASRRQVLAR